jgi:hypothetical protein
VTEPGLLPRFLANSKKRCKSPDFELLKNPFYEQNWTMMTLGNMRQNGVRTLAVTCGALWCHHEAVLDVAAYSDDLPVPPSVRAWSARCAALSVRMQGLIGMNLRPPVCLVQAIANTAKHHAS